jgi:hypothetical protein
MTGNLVLFVLLMFAVLLAADLATAPACPRSAEDTDR